MYAQVKKQIEDIGDIDIMIGVPSHNNASTVAYVINQVAKGLKTYFPDKTSVIMNIDGRSKDGTRDVARAIKVPVPVIVVPEVANENRRIYGKGNGIHIVMDVANDMNAKAFAMFDADLRSITPDWVKLILEPIVRKRYDFIAPRYTRHKYDATITNFIAYPTVRMLFGKDIRQPIGGDFGFSRRCFEEIRKHPISNDPAFLEFGIDIFVSSMALAKDFKVAEAALGVKIHDEKDPGKDLSPMFYQVVTNLFNIISYYDKRWPKVKGVKRVHLFRDDGIADYPPLPINVNATNMIRKFNSGRKEHSKTLKKALSKDTYSKLRDIRIRKGPAFSDELWVNIFFELGSEYFKTKHPDRILEALLAMWIGRVSSFVIEAEAMNNDDAEELIQRQADVFLENKKEFLLLYSKRGGGS